jgi:hypothetical protein
MVGFTLVSRSYYYYICVDEVPAPRSRPTTVRQGNGGLSSYLISYLDIFHLPPHGRKGPLPGCSDDQVARCARNHPACFEQPAAT